MAAERLVLDQVAPRLAFSNCLHVAPTRTVFAVRAFCHAANVV